MYPHLLQLAEKVRQEQAAGGRIITGPVVLKGSEHFAGILFRNGINPRKLLRQLALGPGSQGENLF